MFRTNFSHYTKSGITDCGLFFDYGVFAHFVHILPVTPEVSSRVSKSGPVGWVI